MSRAVRLGAALGAALLAACLLAAWLVPPMLDWERYRGTVEQAASAGLGRPVRIAGRIRLSLLPTATLRASDVTIEDAGDGASATANELLLRAGLSALSTGRIEPQALVLRGAQMRLPWPMAGFNLGKTALERGLQASLENSALTIGELAITDIQGTLTVGGDRALSATGRAKVLARPWTMTGRLGRPGADGAATLDVSLDGQGGGIGTGMMLTGQVAADGTVTGRVTGRGPDLSILLPAPSQGWTADGRLIAGSGLLVADDLDLTIGGSPARGAVALRLLPALHLDAALATNRLDLDAWLPPLLAGQAVPLPTGIDLSAENATLMGGTVRRVRAGFELSSQGMALRDSSAMLPGEAELHLAGSLARGVFSGDASVAMPDIAATATWLRPLAGAIFTAVPFDRLHDATLAAHVQADRNGVALSALKGEAGGTALNGDLAIRTAARPAVTARLDLMGGSLAPSSTPKDLAAAAALVTDLPRRFASVDADVMLTAHRLRWGDALLDPAVLDVRAQNGSVTIRRAEATGPDGRATASGSIDSAGRFSDGRLQVQVSQAERLGPVLPGRGRLFSPGVEWPGDAGPDSPRSAGCARHRRPGRRGGCTAASGGDVERAATTLGRPGRPPPPRRAAAAEFSRPHRARGLAGRRIPFAPGRTRCDAGHPRPLPVRPVRRRTSRLGHDQRWVDGHGAIAAPRSVRRGGAARTVARSVVAGSDAAWLASRARCRFAACGRSGSMGLRPTR